MTLQTTRDDLLLSLVRGNLHYLGEHLAQVSQARAASDRTVGHLRRRARIDGMLEARRRWTGAFDYVYQDQSSLLGAAMLGQIHLTGQVLGRRPSVG